MSEPSADIPFTSSDVWLLLAMSYAAHRQPATLRSVIEAGDAINKAVFTPQELRRGFSKLLAAGFVTESEWNFALTAEGRELLETAAHLRSVYDQWTFLEGQLQAQKGVEDSPTFETPQWSYAQITDERVRAAITEYSAAVESFIREAMPGKPKR